MEDNYRYEPIPLPVPDVIGGQADSSTQIAIDQANNVPGPGDPTSSPFGDQTVNPVTPTGGGGGGGGSCSTPFLASTLGVTTINLSCSGNTAEITNSHANLNDGGGNTASLDGAAGRVQAENSNGNFALAYSGLIAQVASDDSDWLSMLRDDFDLTNDVQIKLQSLDVCHMGTAGKRTFLCGDAYAP